MSTSDETAAPSPHTMAEGIETVHAVEKSVPQPSRLHAIVFDLDGVIVESEPIWDAAKQDVINQAGGTWSDQAARDMMGMSPTEWPRYMRDQLGVPGLTLDEIRNQVLRGVQQRYANELPLINGAFDAVRNLSEQWPVALASSSDRVIIDLVLEVSGLRRFFTAVVASEEVAAGKPAPDVFVEACRQLGVEPGNALAVEDSTNGIRSAKAAGMWVAAIPNANYRPVEDVLALADVVLSSISELTVDNIRTTFEPHLIS